MRGDGRDVSFREPAVGLCAECRHARRVHNARGSRFWRCGLADSRPAFVKYPALPVLACDGFEAQEHESRESS